LRVANSIVDLVGGTPLVRLNRVTRGVKPRVYAKLEFFNPGGSVKDRVGVQMLLDAERKGIIRPGYTIVEPTSGNTGMGLALVAIQRGYKIVFTVPDKMSRDKIDLLRAVGAKVRVTPTKVPPGHPANYVEVARKIVRETKNAYMPNQYENPSNPRAHYKTTGPEIWEQTRGKIDVLVAGVGTGGSITGVGEVLRDLRPGFHSVAVEPTDSPVLSGGQPGPHKIQGIGAGFVPGVLNTHVYDEVITCRLEDAYATSRQLARSEGILVGISSGANVWAAIQVAQRPESAGKVIVTILCDTGERYLSTPLFAEA